jgi:uncharacterized protein
MTRLPDNIVAMSLHGPITSFSRAVRASYGRRVERIVMFGSQVRGDASADSDVDIAVFLHGLVDRQAEISRLLHIERATLADDGPIFDIVPLPAGAWADRTTFMHELRREGIDL